MSTTTDEPRVVVVTATPVLGQPADSAVPTPFPTSIPAPTQLQLPPVSLSPVPDDVALAPTADPSRFDATVDSVDSHIVQAGDTLYGIAQRYGTSIDSILAINTLTDPNVLEVGQVISLPSVPENLTPSFKLIPDARFVRGPGSAQFDTLAFVGTQRGYIRQVTDQVTTRLADGSNLDEIYTGAQIVERISMEYSIDPRLLLAILEYYGGWLSNPDPLDNLKEDPFGSNRDGFYLQLAWFANQLNAAYYGWKYRGLAILELSPVDRYLYNPGLNAGTVAVQYGLSLLLEPQRWLRATGDTSGLFATYFGYFGDPFADRVDPVVPASLQQPPLTLPFAAGETWFFTGSAHGGWASGSAWAAVDFAPPDEREDGVFCFVSQYWVRAVAPGIIARSDNGAVVLDLDMDGDETTGWTIFYLHIAEEDRVSVGTVVAAGDPIGRASCEGGFSTATHLHIGRRYNGEWIPADCFVCGPQDARPAFDLGGWRVVGIRNQEYQGYLDRGGDRRTAEQGRVSLVNRISW